MVEIGIYIIKNILNNKIYVGSSNNIKKRWYDHKFLLNKNAHHSLHLQNAWNKYGEENFIFEMIEECEEEELFIREQWHLNNLLEADKYILGIENNFLKLGYNVKPFCESNRGFKHSVETLDKIRKSKNLEVYAIDACGSIVGDFLSTSYAAIKFNISTSSVRNCIKKKKCSDIVNIGFIYKKDYQKGFLPKIKNIKFPKIKEGSKSLWQEVYIYDIYGNFIEKVDNQLLCSKKYNISAPNLNRILNNTHTKLPKNNIFSKKDIDGELKELKEIHQNILNLGKGVKKFTITDRFNNVLSYSDSIYEIALILKTSSKYVYSSLSQKRRYVKNYKIIKNK